eukprot:CAMPEP_0172301308 /NCGR_PEP_ID=MMETSP1058-20130122/3229_1 /TAXON_ID=83371 /ORGANISM="Detonula confervacea, Strain CCMP 353" /LENGTH=257 /DNA_ID=CAMNT_0013011371 /DNA_START=145 /DNA_END=918 /DNA_ORIENTATION=-
MLSTNNCLCLATFAASIIGATSFSPIHYSPKRAVTSIHRRTLSGECSRSYQSSRRRQTNLYAESETDENGGSGTSKISALPPAAISSLPPAKDDKDVEPIASSTPPPSSAAGTTVLFIDQQTKRILIEELGYKRGEVERLRPELAKPILSQRIYRPQGDGELPEEWLLSEKETSSGMLQRLENESKYPLKFPLLGVSLVLFGKGLSDALITIIKVNIDFPGVSLADQFMGVPILAIDAVCVVVGAALASWTWKTMKD